MHLRELTFDPNNARRHNPRNIGMIAESLQRFGANRSISIDEANVIMAGNGVVEAAMQIGVEHVRVYDQATGTLEPEPPDGAPYIFAVRVSGLTPEQKTLYALADNRTAELATWEPDILQALNDSDLDLGMLWFEPELDRLLNSGNLDDFDPMAEWQGMPGFDHEDERPVKQLIINFRHADDVERFSRLIEQNVTMSTKSVWYPERVLEPIRDKAYVSDVA